MPKKFLLLELPTDPVQTALQLQTIKDACVQAMFLKIDSLGFIEATDGHFTTWQSIYLQAHTGAVIPSPFQPHGEATK